jgi:hypothetical protein
MREIKISLETATRWYNGADNELKDLALQTYPELGKKLKNWEDLKKIKGYYINNNSYISYIESASTFNEYSNLFKTEKQAKSAVAMAKLSQLMSVYNDGWVADWSDFRQDKYCICFKDKKLQVFLYVNIKQFLTFKTVELAEEFLENFREDIETYFNF